MQDAETQSSSSKFSMHTQADTHTPISQNEAGVGGGTVRGQANRTV